VIYFVNQTVLWSESENIAKKTQNEIDLLQRQFKPNIKFVEINYYLGSL